MLVTRWLVSAVGAATLAAAAHAGTAAQVTGDYVEARTCNVYTGACHANGEAVTEGREALLCWHVETGTVSGTRLDGLTAVAVVEGSDNLGWAGTVRRSVLYIDEKATGAQAKAFAGSLVQAYGKALGHVAAVKTAPVEFARRDLVYTVHVPGVAELRTTRYACEHCIMPHTTWYEPFVPLQSGLVARAAVSQFAGSSELPVRWLRRDENSGFAGRFTL